MLVAVLAGCAGDPPTANNQDGCGSVTGPTLHNDEQITINTTWTKCGNPHIVSWGVSVGSETSVPVLTLEPGVVVRFQRSPGNPTFIRAGVGGQGGLVVNGTAAEPVVMKSDAGAPARGDYLGIYLGGGTVNTRLTHLTMRDCGATGSDPLTRACIHAQGNGEPSNIVPILQNVTVDGSADLGIWFHDGAAFGAGSTALTVRNTATYPVSIQQEQAGSLPAGGTYTANGRNYIWLTWGSVGGNSVAHSQTWINPGVPYVVGGEFTYSDIVVGGNVGDVPAVLTLTPGSVFRMQRGSVIVVGISTAGGALVARGTAADPIIFTADTTSPVPGFWVGLQIFEFAKPGTVFDHTVIEYAGSRNGVSPGDSANVLATVDLGAIITNSVIRNSGGCGISRARLTWAVPLFVTDYTAGLGNTFTGNAMAAQCGPYSY